MVICTSCGYRGAPRSYGCMQVGSTLFLGLFFLLPGILYAMYIDRWRKRCPNCDLASLVPANSPRFAGEVSTAGQAEPSPTKGSWNKGVIAGVVVGGVLSLIVIIAIANHQVPAEATPAAVAAVQARDSEQVQLAVQDRLETLRTATEPAAPIPQPQQPGAIVSRGNDPQFESRSQRVDQAVAQRNVRTIEEVRAAAAAKGHVFIGNDRTYHEPTCPNTTRQMATVWRGAVAVMKYDPAPDCHQVSAAK